MKETHHGRKRKKKEPRIPYLAEFRALLRKLSSEDKQLLISYLREIAYR